MAPVLTSWPPPSHLSLVGSKSEKPEAERARAALEKFLPRAFRRPVSDLEIEQHFAIYEHIRPKSESFEAAMRETFAAVLVSPNFLHLIETNDDFSIASRLSYFLWSTMPDQRLSDLAQSGKLSDRSVLEAEVERMIDDPRASEFVTRFADQWFDLGGLDRVAVNPEFFPDFDDDLKAAMQTETREVFGEILRGDLSCLELIDSNWTIANRALATHYGLKNRPRSGQFERVALLPEDGRGGILGHGSFLLSNSNGEASHPIKRAVWILDRLLDSPPAPPPPDVPELDAESPDFANLTLKEQLAAHREKAACNDCHAGIDPWGIALENFDASGLFRTEAAVRIGKKGAPAKPAPKLDPVTELPNGTALTGADELKRYLLEERREHFARAVVNRMATYALGRSLDLGDREELEKLRTDFAANDFRLRGLIVDLVTNDLFSQN
ncbi:MAG: DUF1592 domain-containing protein [Verrucomicrobiales bacterium]|nr:DUF1592 domain-containing protein [Verrucomicrobiales bacterium]